VAVAYTQVDDLLDYIRNNSVLNPGDADVVR